MRARTVRLRASGMMDSIARHSGIARASFRASYVEDW